jgi:TetR/AcrR family transcriptional regulator, transcriptional repressor for nem operon
MRYDAEHKQKTRERVLKEAARAIRAAGPHKVGVAAVMAKAGLTHGGFYAHFASKDELIAAAIGQMFEESARKFAGQTADRAPRAALASFIDFYLSREHRDARKTGCPLPFLSADLPRLRRPARERFAQGVAALTDRIGGLLEKCGCEHAEEEASSVLSELVGALSLARAEPDSVRADAILAHSRSALKRRLGLEDSQ